MTRMEHENLNMIEKIKENEEKVKQHKQLPYLVSNIVEVRYQDVIILSRNILK